MKRIILYYALTLFFLQGLFGESDTPEIFFTKLVNNYNYKALVKRYLENTDPESVKYNSQGYNAYEEGNFDKAQMLLKKATLLDPGNHFAHYNLACVLSLLMKNDRRDRSLDIIQHLEAAFNGDIFWVYKAFSDSDLDSLRKHHHDFERFFPIIGDSGFDFYYQFLQNGTGKYGLGIPDQRGSAGGEDVQKGLDFILDGYYCLLGNFVLVFIPEIILLKDYPAMKTSCYYQDNPADYRKWSFFPVNEPDSFLQMTY